jgi:hypothetical protein
MNVKTPDAYYAIRGAFELVDTHITNVYADINRVELNSLSAGKIVLLLVYIVPTVLYTFRIIFQISLNYSVLANVFELMHVVGIYSYFVIEMIW